MRRIVSVLLVPALLLPAAAAHAQSAGYPDPYRLLVERRSGAISIVRDTCEDQQQLVLGDGRSPVWSPDGAHVAFWRHEPNGPGVVMVMSAGGGAVETVTAGSDPAWSPDGTRLAVSLVQSTTC